MMILGFILAFFLFGGLNFYLVARIFIFFWQPITFTGTYWIYALGLLFLPFLLQIFPQWFNHKFFSILGTLGTWIFIGIVVGGILAGMGHLISFVFDYFTLKIGIGQHLLIGAIIAAILWSGIYNAFSTQTTELKISDSKITQSTKVLFITDLHLNEIFAHWQIKKINQKIQQLKPDVVLFGGDFFDKADLRLAQNFALLNTPENQQIPMYAVAGNHDMMGNVEALEIIQNLSPIKFLAIHQANQLYLADNNISLLGIPDKSQWKNQTLESVFSPLSIDSDSYTILLTHQPIALAKLTPFEIDLGLAGHTHRGQFYGARELVALGNDYSYGLYQEWGKNFFVTQGIGVWGLLFRLGTRSEVVLIQLDPEK